MFKGDALWPLMMNLSSDKGIDGHGGYLDKFEYQIPLARDIRYFGENNYKKLAY
jgi:hypothetical protein